MTTSTVCFGLITCRGVDERLERERRCGRRRAYLLFSRSAPALQNLRLRQWLWIYWSRFMGVAWIMQSGLCPALFFLTSISFFMSQAPIYNY